mmetsp:Transcript_117192/g.251993  ORF Transcript_117192/g.251993 Transcript_117192/m.251993 type:complete len:83 (-) Transcript_117192:543-791(-)
MLFIKSIYMMITNISPITTSFKGENSRLFSDFLISSNFNSDKSLMDYLERSTIRMVLSSYVLLLNTPALARSVGYSIAYSYG